MTYKLFDTPAISVMMCTNVWDVFCERALLSIEEQIFSDFEIIIVANSMADESFQQLVDRAKSDSRTRVFRTEVAGVTFSRNLALHHSRGSLVAVMDFDDIAYPSRLLAQENFLRLHPEVSVCGSGYDLIDADDKKLDTFLLPESNRDIRNSLFWRNPLCHPTVMFRASCIRDVGGYGGNSAEDYDLWIRLFEDEGIRFANLPDPLLGYRTPVVSVARRSRRAYSHVAAAQFRAFALMMKPLWLAASAMSLLKCFLRSVRP